MILVTPSPLTVFKNYLKPSLRKIKSHVDFNMEIDMWKYGMTMMKYGPTTMKYHLTGVIVHHHHYTAFVKCHDKQVWYHIDDTLIR